MKTIRSILLTVFLAVVFTGQAAGQGSLLHQRHKWGFDLGYGNQGELNVPYFYQVYMLQYQYFYRITGKEHLSVEFLAQPQFNVSRFRAFDGSPDITRGYEYGLNGGFLIRGLFFDEHVSPYLCISAGPHHVSGVPDRQSPGFIFSDNLFAGLNIGLSDSFCLDLRFGFRHISNAGLQNPNGGINNFFGNGGFVTSF